VWLVEFAGIIDFIMTLQERLLQHMFMVYPAYTVVIVVNLCTYKESFAITKELSSTLPKQQSTSQSQAIETTKNDTTSRNQLSFCCMYLMSLRALLKMPNVCLSQIAHLVFFLLWSIAHFWQ